MDFDYTYPTHPLLAMNTKYYRESHFLPDPN